MSTSSSGPPGHPPGHPPQDAPVNLVTTSSTARALNATTKQATQSQTQRGDATRPQDRTIGVPTTGTPASGGHRFPVTPLQPPTSRSNSVSVTLNPPPSQVQSFPLTFRSPVPGAPTSTGLRPPAALVQPPTVTLRPAAGQMQYVPMTTATVVRSATTTIRHVNVKSLGPGPAMKYSGGTVLAGLPHGTSNVATVTLSKPLQVVTSPSTIHQPAAQQLQYKPVTITTHTQPAAARQIIPTVGAGARVGHANSPRMTVIPSGQSVNVTINPAGVQLPGGQQGNMARILTQAGNTRVITVPASNVSSGVSIHEATVVSSGGKTMSLPYSGTPLAIPKPPITSLQQQVQPVQPGNLPVAGVIPQLSTLGDGNTTNLYITRPASGQAGSSLPQVHLAPAPHVSEQQPSQQQQPTPQQQQAATVMLTSSASVALKHGGSLSIQRTCGPGPATTLLQVEPSAAQAAQAAAAQAATLPAGTTLDVTRVQSVAAAQQHQQQQASRPGILRRGGSEAMTELSVAQHSTLPQHQQQRLTNPPTTLHLPGGASASITQVSSGGGAGGGQAQGENSDDSGSAALSAASSPVNQLSGGEGDGPEASKSGPGPREKPREQLMQQRHQSGDNHTMEDEGKLKRKVPSPAKRIKTDPDCPPSTSTANHHGLYNPAANGTAAAATPTITILKKPTLKLVSSYRHTWKSRHNHFLRHSDVKVKEERRPTVNELANQQYVLQKADGWKVHMLTSQIDDVIVNEKELYAKLSALQKRLERSATRDVSKDLQKIQEIVKANLQRSAVIQKQLTESSQEQMNLFNHKDKVVEIINKYVSKRQIKKRDVNKV